MYARAKEAKGRVQLIVYDLADDVNHNSLGQSSFDDGVRHYREVTADTVMNVKGEEGQLTGSWDQRGQRI